MTPHNTQIVVVKMKVVTIEAIIHTTSTFKRNCTVMDWNAEMAGYFV